MRDRVKHKGHGLAILLLFTSGIGLGIQTDRVAQAQTGNATQQSSALQEANRLEAEAVKLEQSGRYQEAIPKAERALQLRETALGKDHHDVATSLNNLAGLYDAQELYIKAEPLYVRSLSIRERTFGKDHPEVAQSLNNLGMLYKAQGLYGKAEPLLVRSLSIVEHILGKDHPNAAIVLNNLAGLYDAQELYIKAEPLYLRSLSIQERTFGKDHPEVTTSLNNLGMLYKAQGLYGKAEPLLVRSLSILERTLGKDHPDLAISLNNLAESYRAQGLYDRAEPLYARSLSIRERTLGKDHPKVAIVLDNLAELYRAQKLYSRAEPLYVRSLSIRERTLGKDHPKVATSLNNLGLLYHAQGLYGKAEPLYVRSLSIWERTLGKDHPDVAISLNNLAGLYHDQGLYGKAEPLYVRSLSIRERTLGKDHPEVAESLNNLAGLYHSQGNLSRAAQFLEPGLSIEEKQLTLTLTLGSEDRKQTYISTVAGTTNATIALAIESKSSLPTLNRLALTTLLRRKGRVLDAVSTNVQTLLGQQANNPTARKLFNDWQAILRQQSNLIYRGLGNQTPSQYKQAYYQLESERDRLEAEISQISREFDQETKSVELAAVQQQIPTNAALVEIVQYRPFSPKAKPGSRWGNPRYAAYGLTSTGDPKDIDLGEVAQIEPALELFRQSIIDSSTPLEQVQQSGRDLEQRLIQPIRRLIGNKRQLLISPDGELNRVPFEALVNPQGKYLIEEFDFSYLTSGRDLLKFSNVVPSRQSVMIMGGIDYGQRPISTNPGDRFANLQVKSLDGTQAEAEAIKVLFPNAKLLSGTSASETALKQVNAPEILHLATHGFFLPDPNILVNPDPSSEMMKQFAYSQPLRMDNPLLRSGLALAGFNTRSNTKEAENGVLTAQEVTTLNLHGTQLVVLSACETAVGNVRIGEGVYGLRRSLVIAGSQSQVLSLWIVDDSATKDLMTQYYQNLKAGQGRHAALKSAQLALLQDPKMQHPYYWASFLPSGNWTPFKLNEAR